MSARRQLGQILLRHGLISEVQIAAALEYQQCHSCRLGEALISLKLCDEVDIGRALAEQNDIPFVDVRQTPPALEALRLVPRQIAAEYGIIPIRIEAHRL